MGSITRSFANNILTAGKFDGTKLTGDIPQANLTANAPAFDDDKIVNDISTLGLRVHTQENLSASNTNSQYVDVFQDDTGIASNTNAPRNASEFISTVVAAGFASDSANLMTICVAGNHSLNDLERMVTDHCSKIVNKFVQLPNLGSP